MRRFFASRPYRAPRACLCLAAFIVMSGCDSPEPPRARGGVLDLSGWDFERDGNVPLDGQWEFHWKKLLEPKDFPAGGQANQTRLLDVPSFWTDAPFSNVQIGADGYATYRLKVLLPAGFHAGAVRIEEATLAYRIWLGGVPGSRVGTVATNKADEVAFQNSAIDHFEPVNRGLELVVQVSNHSYIAGGMHRNILLGTPTQIHRTHDRLRTVDIAVFGSLLFIGLYHLGLFFFRRRDKSPLYFGIIAILWALRGAFEGSAGRLVTDILPVYPYELYQKANSLFLLLIPVLTTLFLHTLYPKEAWKRATKVLVIATIPFVLVNLATPVKVHEYSLYTFLLVAFGALGYVVILLTRAAFHGRQGAGLILGGLVIFAISMVLDALHFARLLDIPWLGAYGMFAIAISQSVALAGRFSNAFRDVENLSVELEKKNVSLSKLDNLKNEFLANTSHELKTPIHGIVGMAESLLKRTADTLSPKTREDLSLIIVSGHRLAALVGDILDFSRLKNRDIELALHPVNLHTLADSILGILEPSAEAKGVTLYNDISPDIPAVEADENRVQQILLNLVGNAIKFTDRGWIRVGASPVRDMVEISVADTGIGIPEENRLSIFESFEQVDPTDRKSATGTGLGLSISKKLVELHGGSIGVESQSNDGSRFFFTLRKSEHPLPSEPPSLVSSSIEESLPTSSSAPVSGSKMVNSESDDKYVVLLVDDEPINLRVLSNMLSQYEDLQIITTSNARTALDMINSDEKPDLVLLDAMMPAMNGYETCIQIRKKYSRAELPIIMVTARGLPEDLERGFECGANDYLTKPFVFEELIARTKAQLQIRDAYQVLKENVALEQKLDEQRTRAEKASLQMLRYQLNPHFLFNSIASIRGAVQVDVSTAREMLGALGEYCRLALENGKREVLTVKEELALVKQYTEIESARFAEYLDFTFEVAKEVDNLEIPSFALQPLVENAVKYGSQTSQDKLDVEVEASRRDNSILLRVSNSGTWVSENSRKENTGTSTGLSNTKQRLETMYPGRYYLKTSEENNWVHVTIEILDEQ